MCRAINNHLRLPLLLSASLFIWAPTSFAERADHDMPINLEADQVLIDDAQQTSTFTGNVRLSQGSLLIRGEKIIVMQDKNGFKHATAYGNTAKFRQKREGVDGFVEGFGERIEYDTHTETLNLFKQARLKRDQDEVRGDHIIYSPKTEVFQVEGSDASSGEAPPQRVRAILQPKTTDSPASAPEASTQSGTPGKNPAQTK